MSKLHKAALSFLVLLAIAAGYFAFTWKGEATSSNLRYKLAVMVPETGNLSFIGQPIRNALTLANEEMAPKLAAARIEVELLFADTKGNPREAVTQFSRVTDVEQANGVITTLSGVIGAISPLAKDRDLLLIGLTPDPTFLGITSRGLRVLFSFDKEGMLLADLIGEHQWKSVLIFHSTDSATTYEVVKILAPRLQSNGIQPAIDTFDVGQREFKTLCAKYADVKWDVVVYHGFGSELPSLGEACAVHPNLAAAAKLSPLSTLDVKPDLRHHLTGTRFYAPKFLASPPPAYDALAKRYAERFPNVTFTYSSVYAYDAYLLLSEALTAARSTSADAIKKALSSPRNALTQQYSFDERGDFQPDTILMTIAPDGSFKPAQQ